jgi:hypothetical protein
MCVAVDPTTGMTVIGGASAGKLAMWRLTDGGVLDTTFNATGHVKVIPAAVSVQSGAKGVVIDSAGRAVATGLAWGPQGGNDLVVVRVLPDGGTDPTFNSGAPFWLNAGGGTAQDQGIGIALDTLGRIVVTGYSDQGGVRANDMLLLRLNP